MRPPTPTHDEAREAAIWWLVLIVGLASAAAGVVVAARPTQSLSALALIVALGLAIRSADSDVLAAHGANAGPLSAPASEAPVAGPASQR